MMFYPVERKSVQIDEDTNELITKWTIEGWVAGPLREACDVLFEVCSIDDDVSSHHDFRLGKPSEGEGFTTDWICPNCGYDHIIQWTHGDRYSCPACRTHKEKLHADMW